jgi:fructoselysine-6-P-deglycase FrlB-like protein
MSDPVADISHVREEIARQPEAWTRAATLVPDLASVLPQAGESVAVIGCGTSWFMAIAYAALREAAGAGVTDAFAASELASGRRYDRVVAISRSGTTTEVAQAVRASRVPVLAITTSADTVIAASANDSVILDFADERSVVQTLFATTTLMMLRSSLGEDVSAVVDQASAVLAGRHPLGDDVRVASELTFLGRHWAYGVALEAALKLREAAQLWTEAYPQMEYRHGPVAIAEPGRTVWVMGSPVAGLADDVRRTGASLVDDALDPVADLVRAQLLAVERAEALGLDPDQPRSLTRSVVLTEP